MEPPLYSFTCRSEERRGGGVPCVSVSLWVAAFCWFLRDQVFFFSLWASALKESKEKQIPAISKHFQHYKKCSLTLVHLILATMLSNPVKQRKTLILQVRRDGFVRGQAAREWWEAESGSPGILCSTVCFSSAPKLRTLGSISQIKWAPWRETHATWLGIVGELSPLDFHLKSLQLGP